MTLRRAIKVTLCCVNCYIVHASLCVCMSEPAVGTYRLLSCMNIIAKLIMGVRISVGLLSSTNAGSISQYADNSLQ